MSVKITFCFEVVMGTGSSFKLVDFVNKKGSFPLRNFYGFASFDERPEINLEITPT